MQTVLLYTTEILTEDVDIEMEEIKAINPEETFDDLEALRATAEQSLMDSQEFCFEELQSVFDDINGDFRVNYSLGLWDGVREGLAFMRNTDLEAVISKCLRDLNDFTIRLTSTGQILVDGYHHDGENNFIITQIAQGDPEADEDAPVLSMLEDFKDYVTFDMNEEDAE